MNHLTIKQKFAVLISVVTLIYFFAMLSLKLSNNAIADNFNDFYQHNYTSSRYLDEIQQEQTAILSNIRALQIGYLINIPQQISNTNPLILASYKNTDSLLDKFKQHYNGDDGLYRQYEKHIKDFHQKAKKFVNEMNSSADNVASRKTYVDFVEANQTLLEFQTKFVAQGEQSAEANKNYTEETIKHSNIIFYISLVVATVLSVGFILLISNGLIDNITRVGRSAHAMAQGDLTIKAQIKGSDEIAILGNEINTSISTIAAVISEVVNSSKVVTSNSKNVLASTQQMESITSDVTENTMQVVTAIEEMAVTSKDIAQNTTETAHAAENMANLADEGIKESDAAILRVNELVGSLENSASAVQRLQVETKNIEGILNVIRGISEQTNLLALNAAIEAARAGEQGRGFAVVADEVRTLAQRSSESVNEIEKLINQIAQVGEESSGKMQQSQQLVTKTKEQIASSFDKIRVILAHIDDINAKAQQIATAAEEQSLVAGQISENTHAVQELTDKSAELAGKTRGFSDEMDKVSRASIDKLSFFKV
ncbi:methyl-accepting chemotaxis protein [Catenovulum agarivorans]|uniref:methyl-accepting chemotaxis protein n=1 Tax=Catenovulum agarivorans TaxID=1172192 RepID=UPI000317886A|nr:methyl-accepting chemotaxis protein [Catenovulum agarivorans]